MKIIFEDNHLLVVEKPINIPMQEDDSKDDDLLSLGKKYIKEKYNKPGNVYLGLVHRLDRPVSGICVFAKTSKAASRLTKQIQDHTFKKEYCAIVEDNNLENEGHFEDYLLKDPKTNTVTVNNKGKLAILDYKVIKKNSNLALVKINLQTGRSHQIRVQFSSRNHSLWGDQKYNKKATIGQQIALHSTSITFNHPITNEVLTFKSQTTRKPFDLFLK